MLCDVNTTDTGIGNIFSPTSLQKKYKNFTTLRKMNLKSDYTNKTSTVEYILVTPSRISGYYDKTRYFITTMFDGLNFDRLNDLISYIR